MHTKKALRILCYLFFICLAGWWLADNFSNGTTNWFILLLMVVYIVGMLIRISLVDAIIGIVSATLSFYMFLAVASDFFHHLDKTKPVTHPWTYFGIGFSLFGVAFIVALMMYVFRYKKADYPQTG